MRSGWGWGWGLGGCVDAEGDAGSCEGKEDEEGEEDGGRTVSGSDADTTRELGADADADEGLSDRLFLRAKSAACAMQDMRQRRAHKPGTLARAQRGRRVYTHAKHRPEPAQRAMRVVVVVVVAMALSLAQAISALDDKRACGLDDTRCGRRPARREAPS